MVAEVAQQQSAQGAGTGAKGARQIPIVCPGHTRPLAELQFRSVHDDNVNDDQATGGGGAEHAGEPRTLLVSACHDKLPMLRDGTTGDWIGTFSGHKGAVWCCRLDPRAYLAGTASGDFTVRVWDAITGSSLFTFPHKHIVKTLDFSGDSTRLATGGHEGLLRIYDLTKCKPGSDDKGDMEPMLTAKQRDDGVKMHISKVLWLDDSTVLAAGSDGAIRFWDVGGAGGGEGGGSARLLKTIRVGDEKCEVRDMELSRVVPREGGAAKTVLTVAAGNKVCFYDPYGRDGGADGMIRSHQMPIHFRDEGGASLHPSGGKFIAGGSDLWVRVFDFDTGEELECHKGHHGPVRCLRYAPDGRTYATGSEDGTIRLWKTDPSV